MAGGGAQGLGREVLEGAAARVGALARQSQAQLNGFKSRVLQAASASAQRHLYATLWRSLECELKPSPPVMAGAPILVLGDGELGLPGLERLASASPKPALSAKLEAATWSAIAAAVMAQRGSQAVCALFALEAALALVQEQAARVPAPVVMLLTVGAQLV